METSTSSSLVSKARTAFHSAAAKAEKVLTDLKIDHQHHRESEEQSHKLDSPYEKSDDGELYNNDFKHLRWKPATLGRKHDWQDRLRKIRRGKKEIEEQEKEKEKEKVKTFNLISDFLDGDETTSQIDLFTVKGSERDYPAKDEELIVSNMDGIPPIVIIKQLATAMESGKKVNSLKDLLTSSRDSSPVRERGGLSFSAMKSLVLREKEDKLTSEFSDDEELLALIQSLFDPEGHFPRRIYGSSSANASLPREIHGAPPEGFVVRLSEIIGSFKTLRKMALFWCQVVTE
ncbi:Rab3 gtpase-activating protein catalytic subunit, partial [Thalictrum thalictroides]